MDNPVFPITKIEAEKQGVPYSSEANRRAIFPSRLRELRKKKNVTQARLASALGVSKSTIGLYETGDTLPDARTLRGIVDYFHVSADWLLGISSDSSRLPSAVDELGLTKEAVDALLDMEDDMKAVLSFLIEQEAFAGRHEEEAAEKIYGMSYLLKPRFHILKRITDYFGVSTNLLQECYITDDGHVMSEFELDSATESNLGMDYERLIPVDTSHLVSDIFLSDIRSMLVSLKMEYQKKEGTEE